MKISYNWLQNYFEEKLPKPEDVAQGIIFHSFEVEEVEKVGDDTVFDIKILPDRAHDCLSHWGIAKEVSMIFGLKIKDKNHKIFEPKKTNLKIEIQDEKCLRYMGRIIRNIKIGESPDWLKEKLRAIGQKPINNIVDAANFVMFDLGQPIHSFDLDKLKSEKIIIRNGKIGEKLTTLDNKEVNLDESILIIADEKDPLVVAGIKGGTKAEVDNNTKNIVIEVANFNAVTTRKTAKKINILTDAVKRYENEISPELAEVTMNEISDKIFSLAGGEVEDIVDVYPKKPEQTIISISIDYINKRLGSNFRKEEIESVWRKLNFKYRPLPSLPLTKGEEKGGGFEIEIPYLRIDLTGPHDLTEEVIRILGYDKLVEKLPEIKIETKINDKFSKMLFARNKLLNDGYSEIMTYVFRDSGEVEVLASASDKKFLRNNLTDGLRESLKLNQLNMPFLEMKEIKIFEIGTVFFKDREEIHVAYNEKKNILEKKLEDFVLGTSDIFSSGPRFPGSLFRPDHSEKASDAPKRFVPWSIYPFISRDVAVWVPEGESSEKLKNILKENGTDLLVKEPYLFDSFTKDGKTSYAFRLVFQSYDRTLTDAEINDIMTKINQEISKDIDWRIR
jgi:phenylalanyl-tRNA synthetase beta chain